MSSRFLLKNDEHGKEGRRNEEEGKGEAFARF
jgi:hypothetical protein